MSRKKDLLFQAISNNNLTQVKQIIEAGVSIESVDDSKFSGVDHKIQTRDQGKKPLQLAEELRRWAIADYLIIQGAKEYV